MSPGDYVMIAITDNGEGMPKEVLDRVFEPFYTTKEVGKGSGLELSMVYGFVKQSNGHVAIYSEPELGTTVRIYLPSTSKTAGKPEGRDRNDAPAVALPIGQETVLVVEDDPFVRSYAINCLASLGYRVVEAHDGDEAMKKLASGCAADILFTDIVMPGGISGWELAERAQRANPDLQVLLTSGYALETLAANERAGRHGHPEQGLPQDRPGPSPASGSERGTSAETVGGRERAVTPIRRARLDAGCRRSNLCSIDTPGRPTPTIDEDCP